MIREEKTYIIKGVRYRLSDTVESLTYSEGVVSGYFEVRWRPTTANKVEDLLQMGVLEPVDSHPESVDRTARAQADPAYHEAMSEDLSDQEPTSDPLGTASDRIEELKKALSYFSEVDDDEFAVLATSDGKRRTGLTYGDWRALLKIAEMAKRGHHYLLHEGWCAARDAHTYHCDCGVVAFREALDHLIGGGVVITEAIEGGAA